MIPTLTGSNLKEDFYLHKFYDNLQPNLLNERLKVAQESLN